MGAGGLNGELRDNPSSYIDSVLNYHLNGVRGPRTTHRQQFTFHTSNSDPSFPSSSSNPTSNPTSQTLSDEDMVNCYSCSVNFNIWKRKKICSNCRRDFCKECFKEGVPSPEPSVINCLICRSLKAPHRHKEYLQKIKIKDLCDFLQKKNVPFQNCKEKRELIQLVLESSPGLSQTSSERRTAAQSAQQSTAWNNSSTSSETRHFTSNDGREGATNASSSQAYSAHNMNSTDKKTPGPRSSRQNGPLMRTIDDVKNVEQIYSLSVKELKRILSTNCIDFKGCCEKNELLEKVSLLWKDKNKSKQRSQDSDEEEELCKVCMDSFIDCVLLECGHMVTCIDCSKKVSECPVCRQHIARIVKVFKA